MGKIKYEDDLKGYGIAADDRGATIVSFSDREATEIHIPAMYNGVPVRKIGFGAFKSHPNLQCVYLPDSVRTIDSSAFRSCPNLEKAVLSKELETLSNYAFAGCRRLKSVTLPNTLRAITNKIFDKCYELTELIVWDMNKNDGSSKRFVVASKNESRRFGFLQSSILYFDNYSMVKFDEGYSVIQEFEDLFNIAEYRLYEPEQLSEYMRNLYENNIRMFIPKLIREDQTARLASAGTLGLITEDKIDQYIEEASVIQGGCLAYLLDYKEKHFQKKHTLDFEL
ncbi:MAG: leucine-rich repeat domain-containing protein [Anaerovoracaceae bacterium]